MIKKIGIILAIMVPALLLLNDLRQDKWSIDWDNPPLNVKIPSVTQIQNIIGCEKVDGKVSRDYRTSETQKKWDEYTCKQYAAEAMEPYVGEDGYLLSSEQAPFRNERP
ncbi:hypothetical protein LCGC14_1753520 [marine sediment metagenome]|uniref:Uncharacterized protein n=1 Tax=marine sediment metagenome TaxID=412755 RepID=A0A0F9HQJ8_9ZZZZ